ncbi:prepilin-type N-terminal cleavage/methylation domain-containing protein [Lachnospiraceae bacterium G41]|nr:prepilin-type N-terminal cleavage/methylation domain-containing protein [Lachnospiraceae bacterium G41]
MKNNKGFSLVELIIVIAIMAILVGVMAPQLIKYIEKTNVASDVQLCDSIRTALTTATMDPDVVKAGCALGSTTGDDIANVTGSVKTIADEILGVELGSAKNQMKSKNAKGCAINYSLQGNQIKVWSDGDASIFSGN